ncbi:MAG: hypothetical protein U0X93_17900 [Anaerolineales bacterium]
MPPHCGQTLRLAAFVSALMTEQSFFIFGMKCERRVAVGTFQHMSAVAAKYMLPEAPRRLRKRIACSPRLRVEFKFMKQKPTEDPALTRFEFVAHVHDVDGGNPDLTIRLGSKSDSPTLS